MFVCFCSVEMCVFAWNGVVKPIDWLQTKVGLHREFVPQQCPLRDELRRHAQVCPAVPPSIT